MAEKYQGSAVNYYYPTDVATMQVMDNTARMSLALAQSQEIIDAQRKHIEVLERKKRRHMTQQELGVSNGGEIMLLRSYSDGVMESMKFITNVKGRPTLLKVHPTDCELEKRLMAIIFKWEGKEHMVFGLMDQMKRGTYIYHQMLSAGVNFNPELSENLICKILEGWYFREISRAQNINVKMHQGWLLDSGRECFLDTPVLNSISPIIATEMGIRDVSFDRVALTPERKEGYISELLQFKDKIMRCMVLVSPFLGLLFSLVEKYIGSLTVFFNLVSASDIPARWVSSWTQVFNRADLSDGGILRTDKGRESWLKQLGDETIILDMREGFGDTEYALAKKRTFFDGVVRMITREENIGDSKERMSAVLLVLSDHYESEGAVNLLLPDYDELDRKVHEDFMKNKCLEGIMTAVVDYIESNYSEVVQVLRKERRGDINQNIFAAVLEVLQLFFEREGIDILSTLQIDADLSEMFEKDYEEGDALDGFVRIVRKGIRNYKAAPKQVRDYHEGEIFYDNDYLYFPRTVLEGLYQNAHRGNQWRKALIELKTAGYLATSASGALVKKLQVGGVRRDYYAIKRELLNQEGYVEIVELTREGENE